MKKLVVAIGLGVGLLACTGNSKDQSIHPKRSTITESVYASVKITPEVSYHVQATRPGIVDTIYVAEGDTVQAGDPLFELVAPASSQRQLVDATINYQEAKANYSGQNNLMNNIVLEKATVYERLLLDSLNLKRQERLQKQGIGATIDYDNAKLKYRNTRKQYELLDQKLAQTKISLEKNYQKAKNRINLEKEQLQDFTITAEMKGAVYSISKEAGDFISTQEHFAEIGSHNRFQIEMDIDEVDITKVDLGDSVFVLLDAYADTVFLARVSNIYRKKNERTQTFRVVGSFVDLPPKLYYGFSGEANIAVSTRKNALLIPTEYLMTNNTVLTPDGEVKVRVGVKNLEHTEILDGIDTNTTLLKPTAP